MSALTRPRSRGLGAFVALLFLFVAAPVTQAAQTDAVISPPVPGGTYLAMGDSLAFGYQQATVNSCAATGCTSPDTQFGTGYVDVFAGLFGATTLGTNVVNFGCPGETSTTLVSATNATTGCTTYPFALHNNHPGKTQLQAAVDTLNTIGKRATPVTIDIGANDVLQLVNGQCTTAGVISLSCVQTNAPAVFASVKANLDTTLAALRNQGKSREIIVIGLYNPLYPAIFYQTLGQTGNPATAAAAAAGTDALAAQLNALQKATAAKYRAVFADPLPVFNPQGGTPWQGPPPANQGTEINTICTLTAVCGPLRDIHPTNVGYQAYANVVKQASGF